MNFDDTPQEAAFRAEAKAWIAANAPKQYEEDLRKSSLGRTQLKGANILEVAKAWQKKKADAGWACLHWPKEYGGRGATPIERVIWQQEEGAFGKLSGMFIIGHGMCGPTMMAFAGEDQKRIYLPPLASGEDIWCQLVRGRALFRLWHPLDPYRSQCAEAQGPHHVLPGHEEQRRRDQADQAGQGPIRVQRSLFYGCENPGCAAARRGQ